MELIRLLNVCRLCLKQHANNIAVFSDESLVKMVAYVFRFPVEKVESLSSVICPPCYGTVFNFAEYAENVARNQAHLNRLLLDDKHTSYIEPNAPPTASESCTTIITARGSDCEDEHDREEADRDPLPECANPSKKSIKIDDQLIQKYVGLDCETCTKKMDSFQALSEHCRIQHGTGARVTCCGKHFTRRDRIHTHILNHIQPDAFKCETCGLLCKSLATLQAHRKQHLGPAERAYRCGTCEQRFVSRSQLTNHKLTHVPSEERKHVCPTCAKAFAFKYVLVRHMKLHNENSKEFVCEICAKSYSTEPGLKQHLINHSAEAHPQPRVQCTICNQSYKNRDTLRLHVRDKHKTSCIHHCTACEKGFPSKHSLAAHFKYVHVRDIRYSCDVCGAAFRRRVELREHAARHTGKNLYECDFCGQHFNHSSNLSIHRKNKHHTQEKRSDDEPPERTARDGD